MRRRDPKYTQNPGIPGPPWLCTCTNPAGLFSAFSANVQCEGHLCPHPHGPPTFLRGHKADCMHLLTLRQPTSTCREPERHAYPREAAAPSSFGSTVLSKPESLPKELRGLVTSRSRAVCALREAPGFPLLPLHRQDP